LVIFLFFLFFCASAEIVLRQAGFAPWRLEPAKITVNPGGCFFQKHETLGYRHLPGSFRITQGEGEKAYSFLVTHGADTLRATSESPLPAHETWIFGCSLTHGWFLNDWETYPWLLQSKNPGERIINFGVTGYSTLQSLIQLQEALDGRPQPATVVLAYASFHDKRNTFLRDRRKSVAPFNKLGPLRQPCARLGLGGCLEWGMADVVYNEFPPMKISAFAHFFEILYNQAEDRWVDSHSVSRAIVKKFCKLATERGVRVVVAGIKQDAVTADMLGFAASLGVKTVDISVDLNKKENSFYPLDIHPTPHANMQYCEKLSAFLFPRD